MDPNKIVNSASSSTGKSTMTPPKVPEASSSLSGITNPLEKKENDIELPSKKIDNFISNASDQQSNSKDFTDDSNLKPEESELKPGDKVDTGKQINEKGEVEDSSTKKTLKAVGRGAAAYFSGGSSIGKDSQIVKSAPVDKTIGVVSDALEKVPGVEKISKELDEAGLADGVNDALDVVGNVKNGDIAGAIESAKNLKKDEKKLNKTIKKKIIIPIVAGIFGSFFIMAVIVSAICGPVIGGFLDIVESADEEAAEIGEVDETYKYGQDDQEQTGIIIGGVVDFENLSDKRKAIIQAAAAAVAAEVPYSYGSHPFGAGLRGIPSAGLDCAGFVQWAFWTGLGGNPGYLTTQAISDRMGKDFIVIDEKDLLPGDIALRREGGSYGDNYNHTGIYAGDGYWFHASSGRKTHKVVKSKYSEFKIFLRYVGVDN